MSDDRDLRPEHLTSIDTRHPRPAAARFRWAAIVSVILLGASGCRDSPGAPTDPLFARYVAIGNSITAGFLGAGISDATQRASFPALITRQAGARYEYASLGSGCPAPITSLAAALMGGGTSCTVAGTPGRKLLNNVAVPGADSFDPTAAPPGGDPLATLILDGRNQVDKALEQIPSLVTIWIGSNDVLDAAIEGRLGSGRPTAKIVFAENYARMVNRLTEAGVENGILIGVADVTRIPLLVHASALQDPTFRLILSVIAGETVVIDPNCSGSSVLVSLAIIAAMAMDAHPPVIACAPTADPRVGDAFILDAAEQSALTTAVTDYNTYISAKADSVGFVFVDPNPMWASARARGEIPAVPDLMSLTQPFGPRFSVDGVHPSSAGQILIANMLLDAIELEFGVRLPRLPG